MTSVADLQSPAKTPDRSNEPSTQPSSDASLLPFEKFVWGSGIECSALPHLDVDQFRWTQHDRYWREDLKQAREEIGITSLRYAFPWHVLEPKRGEFDWQVADERLAEFERLGIDPMLDIVHFGTPLWLKQAVGDPEFPEALEEFTEAFVSRYAGKVKCWCPFNEPLVSALFSGDLGFWPPHSRRWRGYMPVLSRVIQGTSRAIRAIRRTDPQATVLLCDAAENFKSHHPRLQTEVRRRNLRRFIAMDLLTGRVDMHHPLHSWLTSYGMSDLDLEWFRTHRQSPDVLGLDYYPHSDWALELSGDSLRQHRADRPAGLHAVASAYYNRYGIPLMLTETSVEGQPINREIWLEGTIDHIQRLREDGVPMLGLIWWPLLDQIDWDGALTHRIGKIHRVGLVTLNRQQDGKLNRDLTPLAKLYRAAVESGETRIGKLDRIARPVRENEDPLPPLKEWDTPASVESESAANGNGNGNGNGSAIATASRLADLETDPGLGSEPAVASQEAELITAPVEKRSGSKSTDRYGIVVFSHLRWGFVWQRPQQFLSRFARKHEILFMEEPFFDLPEGAEPHITFHRTMPNVTVVAPHCPPSWSRNPKLPDQLRKFLHQAVERMNDDGAFDKPLLWYYSPMDSSWSLGEIENRGIVYDSMDELSQFTGAPRALVDNENRLMEYADVVFAGGYELSVKKKQRHNNVHFFGCGVEFDHFVLAQKPSTNIPADIDFLARPILGWFGVIDERVDYAMVGEMARMKPDWSFAMVGPVVKVDPNLLPHAPNLFWLGSRDYSVLPNYCRAYDVCMMPFAINAATEYINPTKVLEYLATGRPVISTPVKDVVRQYSDLVDIVKTPQDFLDAAARALKQPDQDRIQRGIDLAQRSSWDSTVKTMQELIKQAIDSPQRPSSRKIIPMSQVELEYVYQATQGS